MISFDAETYGIILLSLRVTFTALFIGAALGVPAGVALGLSRFPGKAAIMNTVSAFMSLPPVVAGLAVYILLSNRTGLTGSHRLLFTPAAMCIAQSLLALPLMTGLSAASVSQVDRQIRLTAKSLGARPLQSAAAVVREARYGIYSAFIVIFGRLIAEVGAVMMVGGNIRYQTRVMTTAIALQKGMGEFQTALALGIILLIISFCVNALPEMLRNAGKT